MAYGWMKGSRRLSVWSAVGAMTLGLLVACGGDDDDAVLPTQPPVVTVPTTVPTEAQAVAAAPTASVAKSVTVTWTAPTSGEPDSYVLYRSISPDIAADTSLAQKFTNVTSPYVDNVPAGGIPYYYVVAAVNTVGEGPVSGEATATPTVPASGDTGFGNNLSVPIVFADGVGILGGVITGTDYTDLATGLRPTSTDTTTTFPYLSAADVLKSDGVDYYVQKNPSTWQASWKNAKDAGVQKVIVDWGDNLSSQSITTALSIIRVETNLLQTKGAVATDGVTVPWPADGSEDMMGFPMKLLAGQGATEVQGTTGVAEDATQRRVFTVNARLKIEKLDDQGQVDPSFPANCLIDKSVAESFTAGDGSGVVKYGVEINVGGAMTYGFNWRLGSCQEPAERKAGTYRITFSLDPNSRVGDSDYPNNVSLDGLADADAVLAADGLSSYIDVVVNP